MKRSIALVLALSVFLLSFSFFSAGCGDRTEILKVYNCGEYIADGTYDSVDVVSAFEEWYKEFTGKNIKVEYTVFDTNETMYTQIANKHADYDVVCPSDYTVEKLRKNGLLHKINDAEFEDIWADVFADEDPEAYGLEEGAEIGYRDIINEGLANLIKLYDDGWINGGDIYSFPYMWGTFGILYDLEKIEALGGSAEDMQSWEALFGDEYDGHIYMKNSIRDAYAAANIYYNLDELYEKSDGFADFDDEYHEFITDCINYPDAEKIQHVEETLKAQKPYLYAYESDEGKEDLLTGKSTAALGFMWSCDAGYVIGMEENENLWYTVPKEGTNVWVDNWCIPKYARNVEAAKYFIAFTATYDIAYENMYWIGTATSIAQVASDIAWEVVNPKGLFVSEYEDESEGADEWDELVSLAIEGDEEAYDTLSEYVYFLDTYLDCHEDCTDEEDCDCAWHEYARMYSECLLPTDEHVERAAIMVDFGDKNTDVVRMWTRVKAA